MTLSEKCDHMVATFHKEYVPSGLRGCPTTLKHGIRPYRCPPTKFLPDSVAKMSEYWRDIATRRAMTERIEAYFKPELGKFSHSPVAVHARKLVQKMVLETVKHRLTPISLSESARSMPQDTSPGFPYTKLGVTKKADAIPLVMRSVSKLARKIRTKEDFRLFTPCLSGARLQLRPIGKNKPRLVWCYPADVTVFEGLFVEPLMDALYDCKYFAWANNWLDGYAKRLFHEMRGFGGKFGLDFSGFDATPDPRTIRWAFSVLRKCFRFRGKERVFFDCVCEYLIQTPVIFYDRIITKTKGIPSGSYFTQILGSLINMYWITTATLELYRKCGMRFTSFDSLDEVFNHACFLGDDSICHILIPMEHDAYSFLCDKLYEHFHAVAHPDKGWVIGGALSKARWHGESTPYFEFLGKRVVSSEEVLVSPKLVLSQILIPETLDTDPGDVLTRIIGVKWMCGTDREAHHVCNLCWLYVKDKYPDATPTPWSHEMRSIFRFFLDLTLPQLKLPSDDEVRFRYQ